MQSGTYMEYFCAPCGWHKSHLYTKENEKSVKEILVSQIKNHTEKCPLSRDVFSSKTAKELLSYDKP